MQYVPGKHAARSTKEFVFHQLLPYLGNKRHLLDLIGRAIDATGGSPASTTFVDAFAGSGVVARYAKQRGFAVAANDWEPYARVVNTAAIACNVEPADYRRRIAELNALPGVNGWVTRTLCPRDDDAPDPTRERLFYRRASGRRFDAIRQRIADWQAAGECDDDEIACLLAPLLYQACWLANTSGVFKGFHAGWGGSNGTALHRILADLRLIPLRFQASERPQRIFAIDSFELPDALDTHGDTHVVYLDPPYNQHPYASNYHVLNSLVLWDQPELPPPTQRGCKAAIRPDWRQRRSPFNDRAAAAHAFARLLQCFERSRHLLVSYSTDGTIPLERLCDIAAKHGALDVHCRSYKRYRTSPTRPSPRPRNVEFVLRIDRGGRMRRGDAARIVDEIGSVADRAESGT